MTCEKKAYWDDRSFDLSTGKRMGKLGQNNLTPTYKSILTSKLIPIVMDVCPNIPTFLHHQVTSSPECILLIGQDSKAYMSFFWLLHKSIELLIIESISR
jgi:hypothetical protein